MLTKEQMLQAMERECDIVVHLHGKVPQGGKDFRFTEPQRSTLELLRYLTFVGTGFTSAVLTSDWSAYTAGEKAAEALGFDEIPAAMEKQKEALRALFADVTEEDLLTKTFTQPWGNVQPLGHALVVSLEHRRITPRLGMERGPPLEGLVGGHLGIEQVVAVKYLRQVCLQLHTHRMHGSQIVWTLIVRANLG